MIEKEDYLPVTFKRAAMIYWAIMWRAVLIGVVAGLLVGILIGIIVGLLLVLLHVSPENSALYLSTTRNLGMLIGTCIGFYVHIRVLKYVFEKKKFNGFRIALITNDKQE